MNRHPPRRSPADMRPILLVALALYLLVSFAMATMLGLAGEPAGQPHPPAGLGL